MDIENLIAKQDEQSQLNVQIPKKVLVQIEGVENYVKTMLVGMVPVQYLIMLTPRGNPSIKQKFFEGNTLLVRYFQDGTIFAFQSNIIGLSHDPYPLVFVAYPKIVSNHELRKQRRASCQVPVKVTAGGRQYSAVMLDISKGGCRFAIVDASLKAPPMEEEDEVELLFRLFEEKDPLACNGIVRNTSLEDNVFIAGVQFVGLDHDAMSTIDYFVSNTEMWSRIKESISHMKE